MEVVTEIFNDDAIRAMQGLETESIDLVLTDPPYGLQPHTAGRGWGKLRKNSINETQWDNLTDTDFTDLTEGFMTESFRALKKGGAMVVF